MYASDVSEGFLRQPECLAVRAQVLSHPLLKIANRHDI